MKIAQYTQDDAHLLEHIASRLPLFHGLRYPSFVNHYYGRPDRATLLMLVNDDQQVLGTLGYENMPFETPSGSLTLSLASNFHAFEPGSGGLLFLHWLKSTDCGFVWGGNENTQRVIQQQQRKRKTGIDT
ncbi:MAG: hypothetical protein VB858_09395, partial [Planctomycetaceae bacterium]